MCVLRDAGFAGPEGASRRTHRSDAALVSQTATQPQAPALELRGVRKVFRQGGVELAVLNGVDLTLNAGEIVALVGPSGAGKSTMLHVSGLDRKSTRLNSSHIQKSRMPSSA